VRSEPPFGISFSARCAIAADQHRVGEIIGRGVDITAVELILVRKSDGMDEEVEGAPYGLHFRENSIDCGGVCHIAMPDHDAAKLLRQRLDALLQRIALIRECDFSAVTATGFGNTPCQRSLVGNPDDQAALAAHEARDFWHFLRPRSTFPSAGLPMA
jgi:hypothetical protein